MSHKTIFIVRLVSAITLYLLLSKANVYFDEVGQSVLVGGYRFLLIFSPFLDYLFPHAVFVGFLIACAALIGLYFEPSLLFIFLTTLGLSCGGFMIKKQAAETAQGAAFNKLALSLGSIVAGVLLFLIPDSRAVFFTVSSFLLICTCFIVYFCPRYSVGPQTLSYTTTVQSAMAWIFCGIGIGIRVFGMFVILPQYLIHQIGELPDWYGLVVSVYGIAVLASQLPAIYLTKTLSFKLSIAALFISCIVLALPQAFAAEYFVGSLFWCFLLVLEEMFAPYIDAEASKNKALLYKELGVGLGGAASVYLMRSFSSPLATGLSGCAALLLFFMLYRRSQTRVHTVSQQQSN